VSDDVTVYHPGTEATVTVPESSVPHLRMSGWLLLSEHQENQAAAAEREAAAAKAADKAAAKSEGK
jgi:hypothetical protein